MVFSPDQWLNLAAGIVLGTLGAAVVVARWRHPPVLSFALLSISLAALYLFEAAETRIPPAIADALVFLVSVGAFGLMLLFPTTVVGAERRDAGLALCGAILLMALSLVNGFVSDPTYSSTFRPWPTLVHKVGDILHGIAFFAATILFPLRAHRLGAQHAGTARSLAVIAIGMFLFTSGSTGLEEASVIGALVHGAFLLVPIVLWVLATRGHHAKLARNVVLASVVIVFGSVVLNAAGTTYAYPLGRIIGAFFLGYAVLRGQVAGLDLKVRFAISKSTIAAVFIAVFFIASEVAQQFFSQRTSSTYIGIGIAGTLVFAMAPIQRAAERLAEKAVPVSSLVGVGPTGAPSRASDAYRHGLRAAMRDGRLTRREERHLAELAGTLGIDGVEALDLREEIEKEAR